MRGKENEASSFGPHIIRKKGTGAAVAATRALAEACSTRTQSLSKVIPGAMLEGNADTTKRHPPPKNRQANRHTYRDRSDKLVFVDENGERTPGSIPSSKGGVSGTSGTSSTNKDTTKRFELNGFNAYEAIRLMNDRWMAVLKSQNDPTLDDSDRPVIHSSSEEVILWGPSKFAFQGDFLERMRHAIHQAELGGKANIHL